MKITKILLLAIVPCLAALVSIGINPTPLFAHSLEYGQFILKSDRPIEPEWRLVLDDAKRRLISSDLYDPNAQLRIFVCNESWRLWLYTRSTSVGGFADTFVTRNIFLRESNATENRIIPPSGTLADADVRPLSYFIAHEATHVMQSREFGRLMSLRSPIWLVEGHADVVAKAGEFDVKRNRRRLVEGDPFLDKAYARRGLYLRYHLMTDMATKGMGRSVQDVFASPPDTNKILAALKAQALAD